MQTQTSHVRRVEPLASDWRSFSWNSGVFDTARRTLTREVEGVICTPRHLIVVTLRGGAEHLDVRAECGHSFSGADRAGAVSFVPADCRRELRMSAVAAEWASIALSPALIDAATERDEHLGRLSLQALTNVEDMFIVGLASELTRQIALDGALDPTYCEVMSWALAHHLLCRYGDGRRALHAQVRKIAPVRLRRIREYVDAHMTEPIRIADLADLASLSPGYFHRAFRQTTGETPLEFINRRRIARAIQLLREENVSLVAIALQVGFISPSHFARQFRQITGMNPSAYRALTASSPPSN